MYVYVYTSNIPGHRAHVLAEAGRGASRQPPLDIIISSISSSIISHLAVEATAGGSLDIEENMSECVITLPCIPQGSTYSFKICPDSRLTCPQY